MSFTVDKCKNFDGRKCPKCGRMMPALCKDQEDLEAKAAAYDLMLRAQEAQVIHKTEEEPAPVITPVIKRGPRKAKKDDLIG